MNLCPNPHWAIFTRSKQLSHCTVPHLNLGWRHSLHLPRCFLTRKSGKKNPKQRGSGTERTKCASCTGLDCFQHERKIINTLFQVLENWPPWAGMSITFLYGLNTDRIGLHFRETECFPSTHTQKLQVRNCCDSLPWWHILL